jgi:hypothetical protein
VKVLKIGDYLLFDVARPFFREEYLVGSYIEGIFYS